jgi:2-aminomuconate deaminase
VTNSKVIGDIAPPRGRYPHVKHAGGFYFISGTSARRIDGSIAGVREANDGTIVCDIREQTRAVIETLRIILGSVGCELGDLISINTFLITMEDFATYNEVYAEYFSFEGPTRTTVAVQQLPLPNLLIEMQAVAHKRNDSL